MSPRLRPEPFAADHERARNLAAQRLDGPLPPDDAGWLTDHLAWCGPCRAVAAEYGEQRLSLRALRHDLPEAPRDLWARTAAAIESQPARRRRGRRRRFGAFAYAPLVGALVVAVVVGSSLFDRVFPPLGSTTKGPDPEATPFALAAGEIQVLNRNDDGTIDIFSKQLEPGVSGRRRELRPVRHARRHPRRQPRFQGPARRHRLAGPRPHGRRRAGLGRQRHLRAPAQDHRAGTDA